MADLPPARILVVDDAVENREMLTRRLQRLGYYVLCADSGIAALDMIDHERLDLMLLDITMPEMDGLEVLRRVRLRHEAAALPIIMVTARATSDDVVLALGLGANDYVTKPIDMAVTHARISAQIGRKRAEDASKAAHLQLGLMVERLEQALVAAEASSTAKSDFLANISHELRTPLNGIIGVANLLQDSCEQPRQKEMVGLLMSSAGHLDALLSDLLDTASIEAGKFQLRDHAFQLADVLQSTAKLFEVSARHKNLDFELEVAPDAHCEVMADASRLRQIFSNLLSNAVKFTSSGRIRSRVTFTGGTLELVVEDTGIGFAQEQVEALFERFQQADGSITRRFGGSGLGLALSKDLAERMGGALTATSAPGVGACFRLSVPLNRSVSCPALNMSPRSLCTEQGLQVLLADDNQTNRKVIELMLEASGNFEVYSVENGWDAVQAAAGKMFDLVLMDVQMPVMDGYAATAAIRAQAIERAEPSPPIIMISANSDAADIQKSIAAGAETHLSKPIDARSLLSSIAQVLGEARSIEIGIHGLQFDKRT